MILNLEFDAQITSDDIPNTPNNIRLQIEKGLIKIGVQDHSHHADINLNLFQAQRLVKYLQMAVEQVEAKAK